MTTTRSGLNLGPLTTTFVYPSSCNVAVKACLECDFGWQAQTCSNNEYNYQGVQDNPDCWPDRENSNVETPVQFNGWGYYSPGLYCPEGYHTACSAVGEDGSFGFQFPPLDSETAIGCCPNGFQCDTDEGRQTCRKEYTSGSFPAVQCRSGTSNGFSYQAVPATTTYRLGSDILTPVTSTFTIRAPMIQLIHHRDDLPPATSTPTPTAAATAATDPSTDTDTSDALATGAIAGIAVGATLILIGIIGIILSLLYRRRRRSQEALPLLDPSPGMHSKAHLAEIPGTVRAELPEDSAVPAEMDGKSRGELE